MTSREENIEENSILESKKIMDFINNSKIYNIDMEGRVTCNICKTDIKISSKEGTRALIKHISTDKHRRNCSVMTKRDSLDISPDQWHMSVLNWMGKNKLALSLLDGDDFTDFIETFSGKTLYSSTHYKTTILPRLYSQKINNLIYSIKTKPFYIMFDESPDRLNRKIINILIDELSHEEAKRPFLLNTIELESVDSSSIVREINFILQKIFISPDEYTNFKLLISDKASYCLKVGRLLKTMDHIPFVTIIVTNGILYILL